MLKVYSVVMMHDGHFIYVYRVLGTYNLCWSQDTFSRVQDLLRLIVIQHIKLHKDIAKRV